MEVNVLFFGQLKDVCGNASLLVNDVTDTEHLVKLLEHKFPDLTRSSFVVAVDKEIIQKNTVLQPNAVVALMPAFSGG